MVQDVLAVADAVFGIVGCIAMGEESVPDYIVAFIAGDTCGFRPAVLTGEVTGFGIEYENALYPGLTSVFGVAIPV